MAPPTPADIQTMACIGPSPGAVTVAAQNATWAAMMQRIGCKSDTDISCALNVSAAELLMLGGQPPHTCSWVPTIDGVDLKEKSVTLARSGKLAKVPLVVGSTAEDGYLVPPNCQDPTTCSEIDFQRWASEGYGFNQTEAEHLASIYTSEAVRANLSIAGNRWYWAQVHAGADVQSTCPARRLARWATKAGQRAYWYYWLYPPKDPATGLSEPAAHCAELKFLWGLRCDDQYTAGKQWAVEQCMFGLRFAELWRNVAASGVPTSGSASPINWRPYGSVAGGNALVIEDSMQLTNQLHWRQSRCDFWDTHYFDVKARGSAEVP
eukprot:COSAG01_NODE_2460_length_7655_cov_15.411858_5_plen_322_part_00